MSQISNLNRLGNWHLLAGSLLFAIASCQSNLDANDHNGSATGGKSGTSMPSSTSGGTSAISLPDSGEGSLVIPVYAEAGVCANQDAEAKLLPVHLVFAFDVSGSMGKLDEPYHDPKLKWDPVVAATKAFFTSPKSVGLMASMTMFPQPILQELKCDFLVYNTPHVPMTALPSLAFGNALDDYRKGSWVGATPTIQVMSGVLQYAQDQRLKDPGRYAIVMVTDGYPQSCNDGKDNNIPTVVNLIKTEFVPKDLPVYVVGVKNPKGGPDTVTDLNAFAVAGGTNAAHFVDTGDPQKTTADFLTTIDKIRGYTVSCILQIPPVPSGGAFDKQKVAVNYNKAGTITQLHYDATCQTKDGWHYDDVASPKQIVLCKDVCDSVQGDPSTKINIEFTCNPVNIIAL